MSKTTPSRCDDADSQIMKYCKRILFLAVFILGYRPAERVSRRCCVAEDLKVGNKCSTDLTDDNFKTVIESNGGVFSLPSICRLCVRILLFCYVSCVQTVRPDLGGLGLFFPRRAPGVWPARGKREPGSHQRVLRHQHPDIGSLPSGSVCRSS